MTDYDKKFKEDLERAQALSLESLALEQFRNKRLQELNSVTNNGQTKKAPPVSRAASMNESDSQTKYEKQLSKSRPRPGTSLGTTTNPFIAPPPPSQRKNSSANDAEDLISFSSPPSSTSNIIDFCNQQSYSKNNQVALVSTSLATQHSQMHPFWSQNTYGYNMTPGYPPPPGYQPPPSQPSYGFYQPGGMYYQSPNMGYYPSPNVVNSPYPGVPPLGVNLSQIGFNVSVDVPNLLSSPTQPPPAPVGYHSENLYPSLYNSSISPDYYRDDTYSVCGSLYNEYNDYDFIYSGSGSNSIGGNTSISESLYPTLNKSIIDGLAHSPTPPIPPRMRMSTIDRRVSKTSKKNLLDEIIQNDNKSLTTDPDLRAFHKMVYRVRSNYKYNDTDTNMGLVISPMVNYKYNEGLSIKLSVHPDYEGADFDKAVSFTCDVTSSVDHVTLQLVCNLEAPTHQNYTLKVWGFNEYLVPTTLLSDYEYIHNCIKLDEDVVLILIPDSMKDKSFARTLQDDYTDKDLTFEKVVPSELVSNITFENLKILLENVESEMNKLEEQVEQSERTINPSLMPALQPIKIRQSVKYIINLMGDLSTLDIIQSVDDLVDICKDFNPNNMGPEFSERIRISCNKIRLAIQNLIEMYCRTFSVNFEVKPATASESISTVSDVADALIIRICAIYRPCVKWEHHQFMVTGQIYHGTRKIGKPVISQPRPKLERDHSWPARIVFDEWLELQIPINSLARESRLVLQIIGRTIETTENEDSKNSNNPSYKDEEIGWAAIQFFDYEGMMVQGGSLLSIWPRESHHINDHMYGPAPAMGSHPQVDHSMIDVEIITPSKIKFPKIDLSDYKLDYKYDFQSLDNETQELLTDSCEQDMLYKLIPEVREIVWEKRHYLHHMPKALPKVLLAANSWAYASLPDLHGMLHYWNKMEPRQALELLLPVYPDMEVRKTALKWMVKLSNDELVDYLPQLIVALRHETYENSSLAEFILHRALRSPRFAHYLFWLLSHNLPGSIPQNGSLDLKENTSDTNEVGISEVRHHRRLKLLLRALLAICGESLRKCFLSQQLLVKQLSDIAELVKKSKDSQKLAHLHRDLELINSSLNDNPTSLPLSLTLRVNGADVKGCSYFPSATLPLKINFMMEDRSVYPAIFKVGDDLQQDMLTLQMIRLMDKLWLQHGLDLKMVAFNCIPTSKKKGMIEMVTKAETLRKIQTEHGLTGSFKDKPIAEWLAKHNPSELEYGRAVQNFTASCAGYCVVTYIMGICDRHNDNIMLKTSGHLFHIDFGKFLGDAQMFGNFKRDRAPFVLTSDMAYVINGGDRPTEKFHQFVDLCCQAFNIIRNNRNLFLFLMTSSGICSITPESIGYMHRALLPEMSNPEAAAHFTRLIEESLKTKFTQFNFFLHNLAQNLAQLKFTSDNQTGSLLSFVPKTYSINTDGRLIEVQVMGYKKRYDPDKYYVYVLKLLRENQSDWMEIQRTYKEFCELHQKLCLHFPLAKLHSLSTGLHMGRQNIKQVALKRLGEITLFIQSLFKCAQEIKHSDLVYTFFHPLLRDQQEDDARHSTDSREVPTEVGKLRGQLKLSLQYAKGVFTIMVHHARGLPKLPNGQEPSTYVKVYLQPDAQKSTKRKTKVVKKNCHPSFMEMLEYRMALDVIKMRTLKATLWSYDALQENEFMGGVELELQTLDLSTETSEWYPLVNLSR